VKRILCLIPALADQPKWQALIRASGAKAE
jgi:hypothetical protein